VAWDKVCRSKDEGGLGVRALVVQNSCILVKLLHRLHVETDRPWASWRRAMVGDSSIVDDAHSDSATEHWVIVRVLVPLYLLVTRVVVGDGRHTSFWHDCLRTSLRILFTHTTFPEVTVAHVLVHGVDSILAPPAHDVR
jgi:hypothetical protein